jgi:hypothetical protein
MKQSNKRSSKESGNRTKPTLRIDNFFSVLKNKDMLINELFSGVYVKFTIKGRKK